MPLAIVSTRRALVLAAAAAALILLFCGCGRPAAPPTAVDNTGYHELRELFGSLDFSALASRKIVIDPGHGGYFRGVTGRDGLDEADVNLGVSLWLRGLLEWAGADVRLTRTADHDFISTADSSLAADLAARIAMVDSLSPDVFLSIHHNSNPNLDRVMNETQTYYPVGRDGPDLDLARAIHRHLVKNLEISPARIMPGNFYVLRNSPAPAALGEPSMLSNPDVERKLSLARKQELEAQAYFLGLLDYFAGGDPRFAGPYGSGADSTAFTIPPTGSEPVPPGVSIWRFQPDGDHSRSGPALDPASVRLLVDGATVPVSVTPGGESVSAMVAIPRSPGHHNIRLVGRNLSGRAVRPWSQSWTAEAPAADIDMVDLADRIEALGLFPLPIRAWPGGPAVPGGAWVRRLADPGSRLAADSAPLPGPHLPVVVIGRGDPTWIEAPGARPLLLDENGSAPGDSSAVAVTDTLTWRPLLPGVYGHTVVIDPRGGAADDDGRGPLGASGAEINLRIAGYLADLLVGAGAEPVLIRSNESWMPPEERVLLANRVAADLYLEIRRSTPDGPAVQLRHHHGSKGGSNWADLLAATMQASGRDSASVIIEPSWAYLLRHTACPALELSLPYPVDIAAEEMLTDPAAQQATARAIFAATVSQLAERSIPFDMVDLEALLDAHPELAPADAAVDWVVWDGNLLWLPGEPMPGLPFSGPDHTVEISAAGEWRLSVIRFGPDGSVDIRQMFGSDDHTAED